LVLECRAGAFKSSPGHTESLLPLPFPQLFYYFAIIEDFILRFGVPVVTVVVELGYANSDLMLTLVTPLEVFRRFIWNYLRLENEHVNNCGNFRKMRDIKIAPVTMSSEEEVGL